MHSGATDIFFGAVCRQKEPKRNLVHYVGQLLILYLLAFLLHHYVLTTMDEIIIIIAKIFIKQLKLHHM